MNNSKKKIATTVIAGTLALSYPVGNQVSAASGGRKSLILL